MQTQYKPGRISLLKKIISVSSVAAATGLCTMTLTGCFFGKSLGENISNPFNQYIEHSLEKEQLQRDELIEKSRELLSAYLNDNTTAYTIGDISCMNAYAGAYSEYLSPITEAKISIDGEEFIFYTDTDTEIIYSNMQHDAFKQLYISELFGDRALPSDVALNLSTDLLVYSLEKRNNRQIYTTILDAYPVSESVDSIFEKARSGEYGSISLFAYFNSEAYNSFDFEYLKEYMDSHSEINNLRIYNISSGVVEKLRMDFKTYEPEIATELDFLADALAVREEYSLYYLNDNLTLEYRMHTLTKLGDYAGVNYISYDMTMGNEDFSLCEENEYELDITMTASNITVHAPMEGSTAYLFFFEAPGYSNASVKLPDSYEADYYDICEYPCGYYSLSGSAQMNSAEYGYEITRDELIQLQ